VRPGIVGHWQIAAAFLVALGGLVLMTALTAGHWWSASSWSVVGLAAGSVARRGRLVWLAWLAEAGFYPVSIWLGVLGNIGPFWFLGAILGGAFLTTGFAIGTAVGRGTSPWRQTRPVWQGLGRLRRRVIVAAVVVGLLGLGAYTGYVGATGSQEIVHPTGKWTGCDTPATRFGWAYQAINYDRADDARLAAENPDMTHCSSQGVVAGSEVVTSDGIPIAGWYIPAAGGVGPSGPTVVIAPGWKSNKSEILKYAPPFHDTYNLLLLDLRNGGRSGAADTTWGLREQLDVRAMIDWLDRTKHPTWIAAVGNSMGGATVLAEATSDTRVQALILDSMHAHALVSIGDGLEVENGQPSLPGSWAIVGGVALRLGADWTVVDPVRTIAQVGNRPVLLTHGTNDVLDRPAESADLNFHAALDAGVPVALQYCRGATHGAVVDTCPADWARWVTSFLEGARTPR
jgi:dienelactone hydrolase